MMTMIHGVGFSLFLLLMIVAKGYTAHVSAIHPRLGSRNGGTRLTVDGFDFSRNQFSFGVGQSHLGNRVVLVSATQQHECDVHVDGSHERQIMCYTPKGMAEEDTFVRVYVDGELVGDEATCNGNPNSDLCRFTPHTYKTPIIYGVEPWTGPTGTVVAMDGVLYTDRYETNEAESSNGREDRILRAYFNGQTCELRKPLSEEADGLYGMYLERGDYGVLKCKISGTYVGNQNGSFIVSDEFGRSMIRLSAMRVFGATNELGMFQSYAEVAWVSPSSGSIAGGTIVTVGGQDFDESDAPAALDLAGTSCRVLSVADGEIRCETEPRPVLDQETTTGFPGNRGVHLEAWNSSDAFSGDLETGVPFYNSNSSHWKRHLDAHSFQEYDSDDDYFVTRSRGFFIPPSDNDYTFYLKCDDEAILFHVDETSGNRSVLARCPRYMPDYSVSADQRSKTFTLDAGEPFFLEVTHKDYRLYEGVSVAVEMADTPYTASHSDMVRNEQQILSFDSVTAQEIQTIELTGLSTQAAISEVQEVDIESDFYEGIVFRLGMDGVFTGKLSGTDTASTIQSALNKLPSIMPNSVTVSVADITDGKKLTVTLPGTIKGDWRDIEVMQEDSSPVNITSVTVTETTKGQSSLTTFTLTFDGVPSAPIAVDASAADVEDALLTIFTVRCPEIITKPAGRRFYQDFEVSNDGLLDGGSRVENVAPFCGRVSSKNPHYLFFESNNDDAFNAYQHGEVCFAYHGALANWIRLHFFHNVGRDDVRYFWEYFAVTFIEEDGWQYTCIDIEDLLRGRFESELSNAFVKDILIGREDPDGDVFIDSVYIGTVRPTDDFEGIANYMRMGPTGWVYDSGEVTGDAIGGFQTAMETVDCAHQLPLLGLYGGQVISQTAEAVNYTQSTWPSGAMVTIERLQYASPPISGYFTMTYKEQTLNMSVDVSSAELAARMKTLHGMGTVDVHSSGDCSGFQHNIEWRSAGGNKPPLQINDTEVTGNNVSGTVTTNQNGSVFFDPIPGDMMRTHHSTPQLFLKINNIPSRCRGDCGFQWLESSTPNITGISPVSGSAVDSTVITIIGDGFSENTTHNIIVIGGEPCVVINSTTTTIRCEVGEGPAGSHRVNLYVNPDGNALHGREDDFYFSYLFDVDDIEPTEGSLAGGTLLTVTGTGFSADIDVLVGDNICVITDANYTTITCITPPSNVNGNVNVTVTDGNFTDVSPTLFNYSLSLTPIIESISSNTAAIQGGTVLQINVSIPVNSTVVLLGDEEAIVTSISGGVITATLPAMGPGSYPLTVWVEGMGYADMTTNSIPDIEYPLRVDSITPDRGSLRGGTTVTIQGAFSTHVSIADLDVTFGNVACDVVNASVSEVVCTVADPGVTHTVTNDGIHIDYGQFYQWDPYTLDVEVGDIVEWSWRIPALVTNVEFKVHETNSASGIGYNGVGFTSGPDASRRGVYSHRFTQPGTYYSSSGLVDSAQMIALHGSVNVMDRPHIGRLLALNINGFEAVYNKSSDEPTENSTTTCMESNAADNSTAVDGFTFTFTDCATPVVSAILPRTVSADGVLTIYGSGFSTLPEENTVLIHGDPGTVATCNATSSNDTEIACQIIGGGFLEMGIPLEVEVIVAGSGDALFVAGSDAQRMVTLVPYVESVSPSQGSLAGNTLVTISGGGFGDSGAMAGVVLANTLCSIQTVTYDVITCRTVSSQPFEGDVQVTVGTMYLVPDGSKQQSVSSTSECTGACGFNFTGDATPVVWGISPNTIVDVVTNVTINGTNFGTSTSSVSVTVTDTECVVYYVTDDLILCTLDEPIAGTHALDLYIDGKGDADVGGLYVTVDASLSGINPSGGSLEGGTIVTVDGFGFLVNDTSVVIGGATCETTEVTRTSVTCVSSGATEAMVDVVVTSNSFAYSPLQYNYSSVYTPSVTSVTPDVGTSGDVIEIAGSGFGEETGNVTVLIGGADCDVIAVNDTSISCATGVQTAGEYDLTVIVSPNGNASGDVTFEYEMQLTAISPDAGSRAGGQMVTLSGKGFDTIATTVLICGEQCVIDPNSPSTSTELVCETPPQDSDSDTCDVELYVGEVNASISNGYSYNSSLTPIIDQVTPARGGTAGGTRLTIMGEGFGNDAANVTVTLAGTDCPVESVNDTQVVCVTDERKPSVITKARVSVGSNGIATQENATFQYVDVWSSQFTWNYSMPEAGDLVVIPADMTVLLDVDTPILKLLLIQGGKLIFDEVDVELNAEIILITDGGVLQVGTEDEPFQHKGIITLHGHVKSKELPIYGTKVLAVREGILDLHGKPVGITWTRLDATAEAGDDWLQLESPVEWKAGDYVVIASTGNKLSQTQNEVRQLLEVSDDGLRLNLTEPLDHRHLGVTLSLGEGEGSTTIETRAEVGLLTHNVVVRGNNNPQWNGKIEACPDGFDPGEFATQTCFQGRFGEEIGSDQFGSQIMLHAPTDSEGQVTGRIENVEVTYAGQAFRLGRYAIHFHLNGDMNGSYVRGCSIHKSFNRAVNVHESHNIMIEHNVIYDIMGGAFFTEDGVETGNVFQYNLAVFVISSTSLQNDDITPAAFWVTNPNNIMQHNAVAGGTHFGFWYRMHEHPDGPSFDANICPRNVPLGVFRNNTVHSQGWFGLWIFQKYHPMVGGGCNSKEAEPAKFYSLTAWNCEKGAESVVGGAIQFHDFLMVHNDLAGIELKLIEKGTPEYSDRGSMIVNSVIAARAPGITPDETSTTGIILPFARGLLVCNVTFINFDLPSTAAMGGTVIAGTSGDNNGGFTYQTKGLVFVNSTQIIYFRWLHEAVYHDLDGSLTGGGVAGQKVVAYSTMLPPMKCQVEAPFSVGVNGSVCSNDTKFHRWSFNHPSPSSLEPKVVTFTTQFGTSETPWERKRITHKRGWMALLLDGYDHIMTFVNAEHITNISYTGKMDDFGPGDYLTVSHNLTQIPDHAVSAPGYDVNASSLPLDPSVNVNGDWYFEESDTYLSYLVSGIGADMHFSPGPGQITHRSIDLDVYQCFYKNCLVPMDVDPDENETPDGAELWSEAATWDGVEEGYGGNNGDGTFSPPENNTDVQILAGKWIVADVELPIINKLYIYGVLQLDNRPDDNGHPKNFVLTASHILIAGGRLLIGSEDDPFRGQVEIILRGHHLTPEMPLPDGPNMGAKALGVFGGLDIHGMETTVQWTRLAKTAKAKKKKIELAEPVDWTAGDEIVIATTSFRINETEVMVIESISNDNMTLTLTEKLLYEHIASEQVVGSNTYTLAAEVGLLTRNVKIIGNDYTKLQQQAFGARVLVGNFWSGNTHLEGYARISNVEFYHTGQEGHTDFYDPRFSLAFLDLGDVISSWDVDLKPSYVKQCSFHHGFSPAIGVFGSNFVVVEDNVVYETVGSAIQVWGRNNVIRHNLVTNVLFPGTFNGRTESDKFTWDAGFQINSGTDIVLQDNVVAGSQRSGFHIDGQPCDSGATSWFGNVAHSCLIAVMLLKSDGLSPCTLIANFTAYHNWDFGLYSQISANLEVDNFVSIDNGLGLFPMVAGPSATSHRFADKYVDVRDSVFVGTSDDFDCSDEPTPGDPNIAASSLGRSWRSPTGGRVGLSWPTFSSGFNSAPFPPGTFVSIMKYQAINGVMRVSDTTFSSFESPCMGKDDYVISTSPANDDAQHPVRFSGITLDRVDRLNKVWVHRANLGKINPADCVDMDCDGLKKALLDDLDGSFLGGGSGTIIPESEHEWDGDRRRGLGDYRIPKTLLTDWEGNRINVTDIAPNKGIIRDESCQFVDDYQAYECHGLDYEMLMLESLDADTETRRVSPIAVLGDGYVDLINGPQDHGWCFGYTCQKRLSTFPIVVATGKMYDIYYTGSAPQNTRLHLLNADEDQAIVLAIYYERSWRLDIFVDDIYQMPTNGRLNEQDQVILSQPSFDGEFIPSLSAPRTGINYFDRDTQLLYVLLKGSKPVDIITSTLIIVTFNLPAMTVDEFFGEEIVNNLALFFDIPKEKIRIAQAVRETRRKREDTMSVTVEVSNSPTNNTNSTDTEDITADEAMELSAQIVTAFQDDTLSAVLNMTIVGMSIVEPPPSPDSEAWTLVVTSESVGPVVVQIPDVMEVLTEPGLAAEGWVFGIQPTLHVLDPLGDQVTLLGSTSVTWEATAMLRMTSNSHPDATLDGNLTAPFINGLATFAELSISHTGEYIIDFNVTSPASMAGFWASSAVFAVNLTELAAEIAYQPLNVTVDETFGVDIDIVESISRDVYYDASWENNTWVCQASLYQANLSPGSLEGSLTGSVNASMGIATFRGLSLSSYGRYFIQFDFLLEPGVQSFSVVSQPITVLPAGFGDWSTETSSSVTLKFDADYNDVISGEEESFIVLLTNDLWQMFPNAYFSDFVLSEGSIVVDFTMTGNTTTVETALDDLYGALATMTLTFNGYTVTPFQQMWTDGSEYSPTDSEKRDDSLSTEAIIVIALVCCLTVASVAAVAIFKFCRPKGKTVHPNKEKNFRNLTSAASVETGSAETGSTKTGSEETGSVETGSEETGSYYEPKLMQTNTKLGVPSQTALYGRPGLKLDVLAGPDPVVCTPPGTPGSVHTAGSVNMEMPRFPSGLIHVTPATSRCQTPCSEGTSDS